MSRSSGTAGIPYEYDIDDKLATVYAGMIGCYLSTNLSGEDALEFGVDYWFEYVDDDGECSVTGMPESGAVFYLCLKYEEGLTQITNFCFAYEYMNARK